jgi:hypothetical protein
VGQAACLDEEIKEKICSRESKCEAMTTYLHMKDFEQLAFTSDVSVIKSNYFW